MLASITSPWWANDKRAEAPGILQQTRVWPCPNFRHPRGSSIVTNQQESPFGFVLSLAAPAGRMGNGPESRHCSPGVTGRLTPASPTLRLPGTIGVQVVNAWSVSSIKRCSRGICYASLEASPKRCPASAIMPPLRHRSEDLCLTRHHRALRPPRLGGESCASGVEPSQWHPWRLSVSRL